MHKIRIKFVLAKWTLFVISGEILVFFCFSFFAIFGAKHSFLIFAKNPRRKASSVCYFDSKHAVSHSKRKFCIFSAESDNFPS
jgi:hypothetical protein